VSEYETIFLLCPGCGSDELPRFGVVERFACVDCGREYNEPLARTVRVADSEQARATPALETLPS
jgi:transposase-like protein